MLLNDKSTDVLSSLLEHGKLKLMAVMAAGWPASSSLAAGMGMVQATPWGLSEASVAVHRALLSIIDGAEPRVKLPETELWEEEGKRVLQRYLSGENSTSRPAGREGKQQTLPALGELSFRAGDSK